MEIDLCYYDINLKSFITFMKATLENPTLITLDFLLTMATYFKLEVKGNCL